MEATEVLVKAGILFVPIPVVDAEDHDKLVNFMMARLEIMEAACTDSLPGVMWE
jgi:hypothetical protein